MASFPSRPKYMEEWLKTRGERIEKVRRLLEPMIIIRHTSKPIKCRRLKVRIKYYDGREDIISNVTEIRYGHPLTLAKTYEAFGKMISSQSDNISVFNEPISEIKELEAVCEVEE